MTELLILDKVTAGYGEAVVIEDASFTLEEGESLALLGRNGVGKSTLLMTLMGLTTLRSGSIHFAGRALRNRETHERASLGLGWVPQERGMFPSLSVEEHLTADGSGLRQAAVLARPWPDLGDVMTQIAGLEQPERKRHPGEQGDTQWEHRKQTAFVLDIAQDVGSPRGPSNVMHGFRSTSGFRIDGKPLCDELVATSQSP